MADETVKHEITFQIEESIGVLQEERRGWRKEFNLVSWNGKPAKYDIRAWSADHQKMDRGVTLTAGELTALKKLLIEMKIPESEEETEYAI